MTANSIFGKAFINVSFIAYCVFYCMLIVILYPDLLCSARKYISRYLTLFLVIGIGKGRGCGVHCLSVFLVET